MVFLLAIFKGVFARFPLGPGGNGEKFKLPKVPAEFASRDDLDSLPGIPTDGAHLGIGVPSVHTGHTLHKGGGGSMSGHHKEERTH